MHFWLGRCLYELDETGRALEQFQTVLQTYPGHGKEGECLLDAGRCLRRLKRIDEARRCWEKLAEGSSDPGLQEIARALLNTLPLSR